MRLPLLHVPFLSSHSLSCRDSAHAVAHTDGLYTKITGGQRVDLFGAQKADLPSIWKELIDAGFESGHAYGASSLFPSVHNYN